MFYKKIFLFFFIFFSLLTKAQVLNDTVKFLYGSNTTKMFNQNIVNTSKLTYYHKDSIFIYKTDSIMFLADSLLTDSMKLVKNRIIAFDTLSSFKKDSIITVFKNRNYRNEYNYFKIDTNISDVHNYNYIYKNNNIYQNLGLLGTASKPVFYIKNNELGIKNGFTTFDTYFTEPKTLNYFNTRSSYTRFEYLANTGDENRVFAEFARNVNRFWNVGFSYQRLNSNKQFGKSGRSNDALASNQDFKIFTSGKSKNERYHFMGSFTYFVHKQNEQGGMDRFNPKAGTDVDPNLRDNAVPANIAGWSGRLSSQQARLEPARIDGSIYNRDRRIVWHFYHQYDLLKEGKLSIFHEFDHRNQRIRYQDPFAANAVSIVQQTGEENSDTAYFYPTNKKTKAIDFNNQFINILQKVGAKTQFKNIVATAYLKYNKTQHSSDFLGHLRGFEIFTRPLASSKFMFLNGDTVAMHNITQNYVGGEVSFLLNDNESFLKLKAEHILSLGYENSTTFAPKNVGERLFSFDFKYKYFFNIGISTIRNAPTMQQYYINNYMYNWENNDFKGINNTQFYIQSDYKFLRFLNSNFKFTSDLLQNYVYFDTLALPKQSNKDVFLHSLEVNLSTNKRGFNFESFNRFTFKKDLENVYRVPAFITSLKIFYRIAPLKKKGKQQILIGIDVKYRNSYFGDAYRPELSLFHLQNEFNLKDMFLIDAFISVKIKNTRVFARMNQINAFMPGSFFQNNGYFVSPLYPSVRPFLNIGFSWMLFDN
ncbi:MAG: hypothetical protein EAZ27_08910 [Cytophagales bacterium]|nr:MAG: hypothetical protein EAZ27_08910 [Cytophagales bacterium]